MIDLDLRNPKIADYLGLSVTTGLTNYLVSNKEGGENDLIHHVAQEGFLDVITAGPVPPNPSELLLSEKLDSLMARLREKYDYVIMQGGINDVLYNTPLGEISNSKSEDDFDVNTFAGGFESYIYNAKKYFKDAKIGYIITYYTPNYTERGQKWSYDDYNKYIMMTKKILDKWNIKYLNLFNEEYSNILKVNTKTYLPDNLHLNYEGYKIIYPYIYDFIKSL